uniref:Pleckstrin homology domain containing, family A member 7a n=1 Tax=Oryzias latipes TaxID=8090 RepID=A0A3P9K0N5_ORYLA
MWNQMGYCNHIPPAGYPFYHVPCSHNQRSTSFCHPVTGQISPENMDFLLHEQAQGVHMTSKPEQLSNTSVSDGSTVITGSTVDNTSASKVSRSSSKIHNFGKREQSIKRNLDVPVVVRGWLYKQDSSGMRLWKRKWFVLADFCLFYYKDSREEAVLGSIPLPSYVISPVGPEDHISRKYAFKATHTGMRSYIYKQSSVIGSQAEHSGMRTYYFSADTQEDMSTWLRAMNQAALMQNHIDTTVRPTDELEKVLQQAVPQTNHVNHHKTKTSQTETTRPIIHEVLLEPVHRDAEEHCSLHMSSPGTNVFEQPVPGNTLEMDTQTSLGSTPAVAASSQHENVSVSAPVSRVPSRAPSRATSTLPSSVCTRNGLISTPSPILEPNGIAAGTYQRAPDPPANNWLKQEQRRSNLEEVEHWIKVQKAAHRGPPSRENTLPRRTPPTQHKYTTTDAYQTLPKNLHQSPPAGRQGEYKYAQDRLSHFRIPPGVGGQASKTVWELYEWHQRQLFRHASPTAPLYTPAPEYPFGPGSLSAVPPSFPASRSDGSPRCVSVPPSSADIPPPGPPPGLSHTLSPNRWPHTPADRVTVRPMGDTSPDVPFTVSPRRSKSQLFKAATMERRSIPPSGYMTHTVSAPSLHGKTADDTYMQLKKDLECLDLKVAGNQTPKKAGKPVKVAESDVDVKLSRLCEQDKILKDLEATISSLKEDKDKLERVLDVSHQQMEQFQEHPSHAQKIAYQQRLLQEDLVTIRAQISRLCTEMSLAWEEYCRLEKSVEQLRLALQVHMNNSATPQEKNEMKRELWRIEDVMAGLSSSKTNYKITIDSVQNPERKIVPSMSDPAVPPPSAEVLPPPRSSISNLYSHTLPHNTTLKWAEDEAPPRPPLPRLYDYEETPPVVPPLPKEASVIRHTSVRGLKRQSDERKRDRESGQCLSNGEHKADLRSYLSEPELPGISHSMVGSDGDHQYYPSQGAVSGLNHSSSISSYVTLRRGPGSSAAKDRPKSAFERLSSPTEAQQLPGSQPRGRMTAEEQLERMKRHQRALVRERKRHLSQGDRSCTSPSSSTAPAPRSSSTTRLPSSSAEPASSMFSWQEERSGAEGQRGQTLNAVKERGRAQSDEWLTVRATHIQEVDVEPLDYDLDISRELSMPDKVLIPERYVESDPEEPPSPEELQERSRRAERIKSLLTKSSYQNMQPPAPLDLREMDSALQQQERIMSVSHMLASEASRKSKLVAAKAAAEH